MAVVTNVNKPIYALPQPEVSAAGTPPVRKPGPYTNPQGYSTTDLNTGAANTRELSHINPYEISDSRDVLSLQNRGQRVLGSGISGGEGDIDVRDALRNQLMNQVGGYGANVQSNRDQFNSSIDRGLNNSLATARRQLAGTGQINSLQGGRALGDIIGNSQRARSQGLLDLQNQEGQRLSTLANAGGALTQQSLQERGYTLQQAKTLADYIQKNAQMQQDSLLGTRTQNGPSDLETGLGYGMQALGSIGMIAAMSDIRVKKNIEAADSEIEEFLDSVDPYKYDYKDEGFGAGKQISVMAQDLEKTAAGRALIIETPLGKIVDYGKAFGLMLAANVHLHKELKKLREAINV